MKFDNYLAFYDEGVAIVREDCVWNEGIVARFIFSFGVVSIEIDVVKNFEKYPIVVLLVSGMRDFQATH